MYLQLVKNTMQSTRLTKADLARMAGVSRAAVTRWFRNADTAGWVNVETRTLRALAQGLGIPPHELLKERIDLKQFEQRFLWDRLYPDMESFVHALDEHRAPAMARLVQVLGFSDATRIAGSPILTQFERYKKFIIPTRRSQLENVWPLYTH